MNEKIKDYFQKTNYMVEHVSINFSRNVLGEILEVGRVQGGRVESGCSNDIQTKLGLTLTDTLPYLQTKK